MAKKEIQLFLMARKEFAQNTKGSCPWPKESGALVTNVNKKMCNLIVWFRLPKNV
jgi:hypothetical protein